MDRDLRVEVRSDPKLLSSIRSLVRRWVESWDVDSKTAGEVVDRMVVRQPAGLDFTHEVIAPDGKSLIFPYMLGVGQVFFDTICAQTMQKKACSNISGWMPSASRSTSSKIRWASYVP